MLKFWHNVEATKSADDLHTMLDRLWRVKMGDIDKNIYKVYWADAIVKAIRTAKVTSITKALLMRLSIELLEGLLFGLWIGLLVEIFEHSW